jgi:hypothetical protein
MSMIAVSRHASDLDRHSIDYINTSRGGALELEDRSGTLVGRLTILRRAIASGASTWCARFVAALHDSRRKQAAIELTKHRHLIFDADTGMSFGTNSPNRGTMPAE